MMQAFVFCRTLLWLDTYCVLCRGPGGDSGRQGFAGRAGAVGITVGWKHDGYDCPSGSTGTMRMRHCNHQGCRLEVLFASTWGTVCGSNFNAKNANVLCKAFGYHEGGRAVAHFGGGTTHPPKIWIKDVKCLSGQPEGDIGDCQHSYWGNVYGCTHAHDVGLCCYGFGGGEKGVRVGPSDFPVCPEAASSFARLRDCDYNRCRVEIFHDGEWGTVCDRGFSDRSAKVVCKSLGFAYGGTAKRAGKFFLLS